MPEISGGIPLPAAPYPPEGISILARLRLIFWSTWEIICSKRAYSSFSYLRWYFSLLGSFLNMSFKKSSWRFWQLKKWKVRIKCSLAYFLLVLRSQVCLSIGKQIMRTKRKQIVFANLFIKINENAVYLFIIKVIPLSESDMQWIISVFAHELVQVLANVIHFLYY